jgi:hypothetical protein
MCGITGYIVTKPEQAEQAKPYFTRLLIESAIRGDDATGMSFINSKGKLKVYKKDINALQFTKSKKYRDILKTETPLYMIGHTRAGTQGLASNNMNNHPIITKNGIAVVHNGIISNDDELFKHFEIERDAQVDSETIPKMIDHYYFGTKKITITKCIQKMSEQVQGSIAMACLFEQLPDRIWLMRRSNPLFLAYQVSTGIIYFSSTKEILERSLYLYGFYYNMFTQVVNQYDFIIKEMETNTGYCFTQTKAHEFEVETPVYTYSNYNDGKTYFYEGAWHKEPQGTQKIPYSWTPKSQPKLLNTNDAKKPIKKPSQYSDDAIVDRLEVLEELEANGTSTLDEKNEYRRLNNALDDRLKKMDDDDKPLEGIINKFKRKINKSLASQKDFISDQQYQSDYMD